MKIALVQYSSNFGGSTISGEMIAEAVLNEGWELDVIFGFDGPFVKRMVGENCRTHVSPHRNWLRAAGLFRFLNNRRMEHAAARSMESLLKVSQPDVVYVNSLVSYAAVRAANRMGVPVVWHLRELFAEENGELHWPATWAKWWIRRTIQRMSTAIVVNSQTVNRHVLGTPAEGIVTVIPNAVPDVFFELSLSADESRRELGLPTSGHLVGLPGTLRPIKRHMTFLDAIPQVLAAFPDCRFAITGVVDSDYARELVEYTGRRDFAERVIFTGALADMRVFYRACDVCCIASESESFGRTAVEAFACRVPLVSTTVGGLADIVRNNENSLTIETGSAVQLAKATLAILADPLLAQRLVDTAFRDAQAHYSQSICGKAVMSVIKDILPTSASTV